MYIRHSTKESLLLSASQTSPLELIIIIAKEKALRKESLEATIGFEPMNQGVADPRLTTWLCRLIL